MKARTFLIIILVILLLFFAVSNKSSTNSIDDLAYVVAIGFDVGSTSDLKISFQITVPTSSQSNEGGSSDGNSSSIINAVECNSLDTGIALLNSYLGKKVNLAHCEYIIFSEELSSKGIGNYIYSMKDNIELRPTCNILVSKCSAAYFLENSSPILKQVSAKYYGLASTSEKNTGYTEGRTLLDFFCDLYDTFGSPYVMLGSINGADANNAGSSEAGLDDKDYTAKEANENSQKNIENLGLAVFKDDILVGELSGLDTIMHLILCNNFKSATVNIPSPFNDTDYISLYITSAKSKNSVKIVNGNPYISCNVDLTTRLLSSSTSSNYLTDENKKILEDYADSYFKAHISDYLYKTSKELKSDICKFGKYAVSKFKTMDSWKSYDWNNKYENSFFTIDVDTKLKSSYLIKET